MSILEEIAKGEPYDLEFKLVPNEDRVKYLKTVVAFANGKGGRLLFGVANDRTVHGIANDKVFAELDGITNSILDACSPRIPIDAGIENIDGKSVIVLDVLAGSRCPYFIKSEGEKDGVYIRVGATTQRADDATRRELALLSDGRSFDAEPCSRAKIDDRRIKSLCSMMCRTARKNCDSEAERRAVKRITPEQLEAWGVISKVRDRWVASNAYALLTGDPAFSIRLKCGLFKGDDKDVFLDRREFTGSVPELIEKGLDYILAKINMGCYFQGAYRHDRYELPPDEMRELVINAFAHRQYLQHDAPVFIAIYDSRIEITSPGGLPRGQTAARALAGYSKIRNDVLAKALNYMRFIEEWGSGLRRVNKAFAEYGLPNLSLEDAGFAVKMNVYRSVAGKTVANSGDELVNPDLTGKRQQNEPVNEPVNPDSAGRKQKNEPVNAVHRAIRGNPGINIPAIMVIVGKSRATIKRSIVELKEQGKIEFRGAPKTGGYYCRDEPLA